MMTLIIGAFLLQATFVDLYEQGHTLMEQGKYNEAELVLKEAVSLEPASATALEDLAKAYVRLKRFPDAVEVYKKLVAADPSNMVARADLAELYSWLGKHDKSIVTYRDALELAPDSIQLKNGLARVLRWNHRYDEAERLYREVLTDSPDNHAALEGLAKTQAISGELSESIKTLSTAIELYPNDPELHKELGTVLGWNKSYKEAIESLDRAIELSPDYVAAWRTKGDVYLWMKSYQQALEAYEKATDLDPDNVDDYLQLAKIHTQAGNRVGAENSLKEALRIDPANPKALDSLQELRGGDDVRYIELIGNIVEAFAFVFVFILILQAYRSKRRILMRRHKLYYYFINFILPGLLIITLAALLGRSYLGTWVDRAVVEDLIEAVIFFGLGASFLALLWIEHRGHDFSSRSYLVVGAHPDDIELGCGGLIMKIKDSGGKAYGLTMTRGERGATKHGKREEEMKRAFDYMELDGFWMYDFPDTELDDVVSEMKNVLEDKIRETGVNVVVTHADKDVHSDHRAVFEATKVAARNMSILCYEDVSTTGEFVPNYYVDVSGYIEDKLKLVSFHKSQGKKTYMDPDVIRGRAAHRGLQSGVQYAEAFMIYRLHR